jgi:hypothetical protein
MPVGSVATCGAGAFRAPLTGLEPATSAVTGRRSDLLSYSGIVGHHGWGRRARTSDRQGQNLLFFQLNYPPKLVDFWRLWQGSNLQPPASQAGTLSCCATETSFAATVPAGVVVGLAGLEPATSASRTRRATTCATARCVVNSCGG